MEETDYTVVIAHKGTKTGTKYKVGDKLKLDDFHKRLLDTNNQYHIPYVSKDIKSEKVAQNEFKKATSQGSPDEEIPEVVYTEKELLSMNKPDIQKVLDAKSIGYKENDIKKDLVKKYFE